MNIFRFRSWAGLLGLSILPFLFGGEFRYPKNQTLFMKGEVPSLVFELKNTSEAPLSVKVAFTVSDYFGKKVQEFSRNLQTAPGTKLANALAFPNLKQPGFYCVTARWSENGVPRMAQGTFVNAGKMPEKQDPAFGISYFSPNDADLMKKLGVGTKGVLFQWKYFGRKGYTLDDYAKSIRQLKKAGITVIGGFLVGTRDTPASYFKKNPDKNEYPFTDHDKRLRDYEAFVRQVVARFKDDIVLWTCVEEINLTSGMHPCNRQNYIDTVRATWRAVKSVDKNIPLLAMGCSGADGRESPRYPFLRGLLPDLKDFMDGFGIDQYTAGQCYGTGYVNLNSEETEFRDILLAMQEIAEKNGKKIAAVDEKGPSVVRGEPLDSPLCRTMANIVAREYIILKTVPFVRHWLYFRLSNWDTKSKIDYGMWDTPYPRHAVSAYAATARIMAFAEYLKPLHPHQDIQCWLFRQNGKGLSAIWYNGKRPLKFHLPKGELPTVRDVQGNPVAVRDNQLILGEAPLYLTADTPEKLEAFLKQCTADVPELEAIVTQQTADKVLLVLKNLSGNKLSIQVRNQKIVLNSGEIQILSFPRMEKTSRFDITTGSGRKYTASGTYDAIMIPRVGGWEDVAKTKPIHLNTPEKQMPGYADLKSNGLYDGPEDLSAEFRLGCDDRYFYIEAKVKDDVHWNKNTPVRCFSGDCIQVGIDVRRDAALRRVRGVRGYQDDDWNIVSASADGKQISYVFHSSSEGHKGPLKAVPKITRDEANKTTLYRVKLPFAELPPLKPVKGRLFGFSFLVFDRDGKGGLYWMEYSPGIAGSADPISLPAFQFDVK